MPIIPNARGNFGFPLVWAAFRKTPSTENHPEQKAMIPPNKKRPPLPIEEMREDLDNLHPDWREDLEDYHGDIAALHADVMKRQGRGPAAPDHGWFDPLPGEERERSEDDWPEWFDDDE
jgi:hypothetical protein